MGNGPRNARSLLLFFAPAPPRSGGYHVYPGGTTMEKARQLMELLQQEYALYKEMYELSLTKREALSDNNLDALNETVAKEQALLAKLEPVARARDLSALQLADELHISGEHISLRDVAARLPAEDATPILRLREAFNDLLGELSRTNEINAGVIGAQLSANQASINMLTQAAPYGNTYTKSGYASDSMSRVRVVDTAL